MEILELKFPDLLIIKPKIFTDIRGYFYESYNKKLLSDIEFVQDNESFSDKGVIRGLHFQYPPFNQGKLVRVVKGSVMDVAVDLRKESEFYGKYYSVILTSTNKWMFWIPSGFAHGFQSLEKDTIFLYKCTNFYNPDSEKCIIWNDPTINIKWLIDKPIVSEKDNNGIFFKDFVSPF